jgi:hypothetical protein
MAVRGGARRARGKHGYSLYELSWGVTEDSSQSSASGNIFPIDGMNNSSTFASGQ